MKLLLGLHGKIPRSNPKGLYKGMFGDHPKMCPGVTQPFPHPNRLEEKYGFGPSSLSTAQTRKKTTSAHPFINWSWFQLDDVSQIIFPWTFWVVSPNRYPWWLVKNGVIYGAPIFSWLAAVKLKDREVGCPQKPIGTNRVRSVIQLKPRP